MSLCLRLIYAIARSAVACANRCSLYAHNPQLVCAVHPMGVDTNRCLDFRPDKDAEIQEQWSPEGYSWYGEELIVNRPSRYSQEEQTEILNNHPFFMLCLSPMQT